MPAGTENGLPLTGRLAHSFSAFAGSPHAAWRANFRDLNAAVTRMATLAPGGRINQGVVTDEMERLRHAWKVPTVDPDADVLRELLGEEGVTALDLFDAAQLAAVVRTCRSSRSLSEASRTLFAQSRLRKKSVNDADRLRKYLARFELDWDRVSAR